MANTVYPKAKEAFLSGALNLTTADVKVRLLCGATYNAAHEFVNQVGGTDLFTGPVLTGKTVTGGVFDADGSVLPAVPAAEDMGGDPADWTAAVLFVDTGTAGTSRLVAWLDSATGLPFLGDGSVVTVEWDSGAAKIFAL